ncbi:hypothetical protein [Flavobacterium agrisoli]|uniref:Uncharacterized protein n=1 Tax=Flavobacterium agrisoli TaxID=2793066 RepID=A0A934PN67_9FLAO|nr:hypothetical protein [Flavobacterium agrisoli]MBK0370359.1 hypothetical protein [Flavobacterium agrisoli]
MKKPITTLVIIALFSLSMQSCKKEATHTTETELTPGQKLDTMLHDLKNEKDTASGKIDSTLQDIKHATKKGVDAVEGAAVNVKDGVKKTANDVEKELKK